MSLVVFPRSECNYQAVSSKYITTYFSGPKDGVSLATLI